MRKTRRRDKRAASVRIGLIRPDGSILNLGGAFDQVYSFDAEDGTQYHWSVAEAKRRALASSDIGTVSLMEAGMTIDLVRQLYPDLNEEYAMTTDLLEPLLFVTLDKKHVLIDGWHRTFKAVCLGIDILSCYVLSEEDADACLILKLAPGKGLPSHTETGSDHRSARLH